MLGIEITPYLLSISGTEVGGSHPVFSKRKGPLRSPEIKDCRPLTLQIRFGCPWWASSAGAGQEPTKPGRHVAGPNREPLELAPNQDPKKIWDVRIQRDPEVVFWPSGLLEAWGTNDTKPHLF